MSFAKFRIAAACIPVISAALVGCSPQEAHHTTARVATVAIAPVPTAAPSTAGTPVASGASTDGLPVIVISASRTASQPIILTLRNRSSGEY